MLNPSEVHNQWDQSIHLATEFLKVFLCIYFPVFKWVRSLAPVVLSSLTKSKFDCSLFLLYKLCYPFHFTQCETELRVTVNFANRK